MVINLRRYTLSESIYHIMINITFLINISLECILLTYIFQDNSKNNDKSFSLTSILLIVAPKNNSRDISIFLKYLDLCFATLIFYFNYLI